MGVDPLGHVGSRSVIATYCTYDEIFLRPELQYITPIGQRSYLGVDTCLTLDGWSNQHRVKKQINLRGCHVFCAGEEALMVWLSITRAQLEITKQRCRFGETETTAVV